MGEYPAYDDHVYDAFDARDARHRAYRDAIRDRAPGRVVLDIGTGRDALWAVEAARSGARHVYAIEADAPAARRAAQAVARAGLGDRVTVIAGHSTEQSLPIPAELCVSEIVGNIASAEGAVAVLDDARRRLTAPGCAWIPFRMQTWAAAVDLTAAGDLAVAAECRPYLDAVFAAAGGPFDLRLCLAGPAGEAVISSAAVLESEIFDGSPGSTGADRTATIRIDGSPRTTDTGSAGTVRAAAARMTGLLLWARVAASAGGGREIDALDGDTRGWAPVYVPLSAGGIPVERGQEIRLRFARTTGADGVHPDYELTVDDLPPWRSPHHGGPFRHTPFYATLFPPTL